MCSGKTQPGALIIWSILDCSCRLCSGLACRTMCTIKENDPQCLGLPHAAVCFLLGVCRAFPVCFISLLLWSPWLPRCPGLSLRGPLICFNGKQTHWKFLLRKLLFPYSYSSVFIQQLHLSTEMWGFFTLQRCVAFSSLLTEGSYRSHFSPGCRADCMYRHPPTDHLYSQVSPPGLRLWCMPFSPRLLLRAAVVCGKKEAGHISAQAGNLVEDAAAAASTGPQSKKLQRGSSPRCFSVTRAGHLTLAVQNSSQQRWVLWRGIEVKPIKLIDCWTWRTCVVKPVKHEMSTLDPKRPWLSDIVLCKCWKKLISLRTALPTVLLPWVMLLPLGFMVAKIQ